MGMCSDIGGSGEMCHEHTNVYLQFGLPTKHHHLVELREICFGCVIFEELICAGGDVWWWFIWCCNGEGGSAPLQTELLSGVLECHRCGWLGLTGLSSSELLNTERQHTGLQHLNLWGECTGCCSVVVSRVVGLKDKSSLINTWHILSTLLREVGMFKLLLLVS